MVRTGEVGHELRRHPGTLPCLVPKRQVNAVYVVGDDGTGAGSPHCRAFAGHLRDHHEVPG
jgi:hypothetical protein